MQAKQNKELIHLFPGQAGVQAFPGKQGSTTCNIDLEEDVITPFTFFFLQFYVLNKIP